ncbi:MAG: hypothetical protein AVDCRST_MAG11-1253, partial [uncultured Gemmatimonadaceae bacterium]
DRRARTTLLRNELHDYPRDGPDLALDRSTRTGASYGTRAAVGSHRRRRAVDPRHPRGAVRGGGGGAARGRHAGRSAARARRAALPPRRHRHPAGREAGRGAAGDGGGGDPRARRGGGGAHRLPGRRQSSRLAPPGRDALPGEAGAAGDDRAARGAARRAVGDLPGGAGRRAGRGAGAAVRV